MKNYSVITLKKKNITDFAGERNSLLKKAKTDWVFFLDADETMSKSLNDEIEKEISEDKYDGFFVNRKNYFLGKYIGTDNILRLGRKNAGKWKRKVHEVWEINPARIRSGVKGKTGQLKNPIVHNSAKNLHGFIEKVNYYSTLHAEENLKSGKRSALFKIVFYPPAKFFQSLIMGRGFVFSMLQSFHSFLAWTKEWQIQKK